MLLIPLQNVQSVCIGNFWPKCATVHGSENFSGLHKKENVPNRSSVHLDLLLCCVEVYFKDAIHNYLF